MSPQFRKVVSFIYKIISNKSSFFFWLFVRFVSAVLPLFTIYLFSLIVKNLENKSGFYQVVLVVVILFVVRIVDNFLRIKSVTKLEEIISNIGFDIHNFFLSTLKTEDKDERHATVQAIRNFADAATVTLNLIKQPGVDSLVSLIFIPSILFFLDFDVFIMTVAGILIYFVIDHYTTQHYFHLKDILNTKTEGYYGKLVEANDFDLEQIAWSRHFRRICRWAYKEWFTLQNTAVILYCLILFYLVVAVVNGTKTISDLVLLVGYVSQTQVLLNSFSQIQDSLADMFVGLEHLAKNQKISVLNLDDLI